MVLICCTVPVHNQIETDIHYPGSLLILCTNFVYLKIGTCVMPSSHQNCVIWVVTMVYLSTFIFCISNVCLVLVMMAPRYPNADRILRSSVDSLHKDLAMLTLDIFVELYSISQEMCTRFCCALLFCGYAIVHNEFTWSIYPYSSGLLCWHWGNR